METLLESFQFLKDSWDNYATAAKFDEEDKNTQVATLLTVTGKEYLIIYKTLPITEEESKDPPEMLTKLTEHFEPTTNTTHEWFLFSSCFQGSDPFDTFVSKLHQLVATYEYWEIQDELIRDRHIIVTGLTDQALRACLL